MSNMNLEHMFKRLEHEFDIENPELGHEWRFLNKLNAQDNKSTFQLNHAKKHQWKSYLAIAASVLILMALGFYLTPHSESGDLADVSPKMAETQAFFMTTINEEINTIKEEQAPEVQNLIQDALHQITILEEDYQQLKTDLVESGDDHRVIYAMISNFQNRLDILKQTLQQIETVKALNSSPAKPNESYI
ncbi:hypothetical protein [Aestuariivivens sediminis]|uniref:hypothetical protein n=1 Tax=Aestuariivivens sediminis TaxID=2913557 RepID=UPI001F568B03|nr:hypothetical protein [Aestuariivivens sediminis]